MSFSLTSTFDDDRFEYEGKVFHVDMSFDNILRLFEMFDDKSIPEWEKILWALEILIIEYDELREKPFEVQFELFKYVMKEFLEIDLDKPTEKQKKIIDYKKDAELIYASFFAAYKIDLFEMHGKLHWKKFQALLTHLDDNSPFKQVIGYRTMKVPSEKQASKEYIQHVRKMKQLYALEDEQQKQQNIDDVFDSLARIFKAGAKVVKQDG
jgi:hypothetical protein